MLDECLSRGKNRRRVKDVLMMIAAPACSFLFYWFDIEDCGLGDFSAKIPAIHF